MLISEFIQLTGFELTDEEYSVIEKKYMDSDSDKFQFCKEWLASGEAKWILRDREIHELTNKLAATAKELESVKEQLLDWKPCKGGTNLTQSSYLDLESCTVTKILSEEEAKQLLYDEFGFAPERIVIVDFVDTYEANKYHKMRVSGTYYRSPLYMATDYNYIRFNCAGLQYEMINGELEQYVD